MKIEDLTPEGKQELALALLLWRDFKKGPETDQGKVVLQMFQLADMLGVREELQHLIPRLPPFKITPIT